MIKSIVKWAFYAISICVSEYLNANYIDPHKVEIWLFAIFLLIGLLLLFLARRLDRICLMRDKTCSHIFSHCEISSFMCLVCITLMSRSWFFPAVVISIIFIAYLLIGAWRVNMKRGA